MSFLLTDEKLSHIGRHIGLDDLTMCNVSLSLSAVATHLLSMTFTLHLHPLYYHRFTLYLMI